MTFEEFPKMYRLNREVIVTEKIDGTNAQIFIPDPCEHVAAEPAAKLDGLWIFAGSRSRYITPEDDNFGFARWVRDNAEELAKLGPGRHFGEWWGQGIQRGYGLKEKRFSLFNVSRWADPEARPSCCHVVPELWRGPIGSFFHKAVDGYRSFLHESVASPGFSKPEGIVVYHTAGNVSFKYTFDKNDGHKGAS